MRNRYNFKYTTEIDSLKNNIRRYNKIFRSLTKKYQDKERKITNYKEHKELMYRYRKEMLDLLKVVVGSYSYFNDNAVVYLTGSYARNTVRMFSDLDLNIVYVRGTGKKYMKYEELFYYYVSQIFDMRREGVHSIITAFNNEENYDYVVKHMDEVPIKIKLEGDNDLIEYEMVDGYKKRYYLQYMNDKNYKTVFDNLIMKYKRDGLQEWSNNFIFLNHNTIVDEYYDKYQKMLITNIDLNYIKNEYDYMSKLKFEKVIYDNNRNIKNNIQMKELHYLYKIIVLLQAIQALDTKVIYSDFEDLYHNSNKQIKSLLDYYYEYNFYINELNKYFIKHNIAYSIHTYSYIDMNKNKELKPLLDFIIKFRDNINKKYINLLKGELKKCY